MTPRFLLTGLIATLLGSAAPAGIAQFSPGPNPIPNGTTTGSQTLAGGTGTVAQGGTITIGGATTAVTITGNSTVTNNGNILQTGTGRTIDNTGSGNDATFTINNNAGALNRSADGDTVRVNRANSRITVNNSGSIISLNASAGGSQALDLNAAGGAPNLVNNYATGIIRAASADAIRPGLNGVVNNQGTIEAIPLYPDPANPGNPTSSDGIDTQALATADVTNSGAISGRHGITGGAQTYSATIVNNAGGTISGVNGSGLNIDGVFTTAVTRVTNAQGATIRGGVLSATTNGDGDGVDVDGVLYLDNSGNIYGYGAKGVGSDGGTNNAEAVSIGGGSITNQATGQIIGSSLAADAPNGDSTRAGNGILVDNSSGGNAVAPTGIYNSGLIHGKTGFGIKLVGTFGDTVENNAGGTIRGAGSGAAIQTGAGADTVTNRGAIISDIGNAIDLEAGNDTLFIEGNQASITGDVTGGAGFNTLRFDLGAGNAFAYADDFSNFSVTQVFSGTTTLSGSNAGTGLYLYGGKLILDGSGRVASTTALVLDGGNLKIIDAGGPSGQTFGSFSLENFSPATSSIIDLSDSTSLTFDQLGGIAGADEFAVINYDAHAGGGYALRFVGDLLNNPDFQDLLAGMTINGSPAVARLNGGYTELDVAPVPEPGTAAFGIAALLGALGRRGRTRMKRAA